jgi:hypothetical protein
MGAMSGAGGSGAMRQIRGAKKDTPELMDQSRKRDGRRIVSLFRPYRARLSFVLMMDIAS